MRTRVPQHLEHRIHALALRQGRSDQNMLDLIIASGLAATGQPAAVMAPAIGDMTDAELSEMKIPVDATTRATLRELAARHGRSQRKLASHVLSVGLGKLAEADVIA